MSPLVRVLFCLPLTMLLLLGNGCADAQSGEGTDSEVPLEISVTEVQKKRESLDTDEAKENFVLIDCRERNEWDDGHIDGAVWVPWSQVQKAPGKLDKYEGKEVVIYCHSGQRSMKMTKLLRGEVGLKNVKTMKGGIVKWKSDINEDVVK